MGFGIFSSLQGAKIRELQLEVLANNLANMQTSGYKEQHLSFTSEVNKNLNQNDELAKAQAPVKKGETYINMAQGGVERSGNPLDLAIQGPGFFSVQTPDGVGYTRNGEFTLNAQGQLVNQSGLPVLTSNGPVTIPAGAKVTISQNGDIMADNNQLGTLQILEFDKPEKMKALGNNFYSAEGLTSTAAQNSQVLQSHVERSNVNLVSNITRIIEVSRAYESLQKTISQQIDASKLLNQIAKIG